MAQKTKEQRMKEQADKLREKASKQNKKDAKEFQKGVKDITKSISDLSRDAEKIRKDFKKAFDSGDLDEVVRLQSKHNDCLKENEALLQELRSGNSKFYSELTQAQRDSNRSFIESADSMLSSLRSLNEGMEDTADSAKDTLKNLKESARAASALNQMSQQRALDSLKESYDKRKELQQKQENLLLQLSNTTGTMRRRFMERQIQDLREQDSALSGQISNYVSVLEEVPENLQDQANSIQESAEDIDKAFDTLIGNVEDGSRSSIDKIRGLCDDVRDAFTSLEIDQILQSLEEQVDSYIENRRQILSRTGENFDVGNMSNLISETLKGSGYVMTRNEVSEVLQDFVKSSRMQNLDEIDDYLSDIVAMQKVYGTSFDSIERILWADNNSGREGEMFRNVSNIAATLENNADLYTDADTILSALNNKVDLIYGIAGKDSKRQKDMLKSVAAIEALQSSSAVSGTQEFAEALTGMIGKTTEELMADETANKLMNVLSLSATQFRGILESETGSIEIAQMYQESLKRRAFDERSAYGVMLADGIFDSVAALQGFRDDNIKPYMEAIQKSLSDAETSDLIAADKASKLVSWVDEIKNRLSDNFLVKGISDFFGTLDIKLANMAHAAIIASNFVKFFSDVPGAVSKVQEAISGFSGVLSKGFSFLSGGISKLVSIVGKFAVPLMAVTGAVLTVKDAVGGWKKSKEWLGEKEGSTFSGKVSSAIGGAIGGNGPGIGEKGATFGGVAKNTAGNSLKGVALGGAIGSIIPGLGTALGAAVGGLIGAITGLIGGKRIAKFAKSAWDVISDQGRNVFGLMGDIASNQWKLMKETGGKIKDLWSDPNKGIFSKVGGTIKEVVTYPFKQLGTFLKTIKEWVVKFIKELPDRIFEPFIKLKEFTTTLNNKASDFFGGLQGKVKNFREKLTEGIRSIPKKIEAAIESFPDKLEEGIKNFRENIKNNLHNLFSGEGGKSMLKEFVRFLWEVSKTIYVVIWELAKALLKSIPKLIVGIITLPFKLMWKGVKGFFDGVKDRVTSILDTLSFGLTKLFDKFGEVREDYSNYKENGGKFGVLGYGVSKAWGWSKSKLGFAGGLSEVPNDGLAYVHSGEAILTKAQAVLARADGGIDIGKVMAGGVGAILGGPLGAAFGVGIFESIGLSKEIVGKLSKGFLNFFKLDEESYEEESLFQKALRKYFGLGITGGDEGTSGASGGLKGFFSKLFGGNSDSFPDGTAESSNIPSVSTVHSSGSGGSSSSSGASGASGTASYGGATPKLTSSGDYQSIRNQDLGSFSALSSDEMNSWIDAVAPENSPFRGKGDIFLKASQESGLDPRYILAHAAVESGWGTDSKAAKSNNYFGYGAFDSNVSNMYKYSYDTLEDGIVGIANKIANGYYDKGQTSLYSMRWNDNVHQYATDPNWDTKIASIMATAPTNSKATSVGQASAETQLPASGDWVQNALSQEGFKEGTNNDTPFGSWIGSPNQPWCAAFVSWALAQAGVEGLKSAAVSGLRDQAISMGLYHDKNDGYIPGYGDIFINKGGKASHTGFVLSSDGTSFQTIEGNAGDMVKSLTRKISDSAVSGFISLGNSGTYTGGVQASTEDANSLSTYAVGTPWVPDDQLAIVHRGEMIVPADYNPLNNNIQTSVASVPNYEENSSSNGQVVSNISATVDMIAKKLDKLIALQSTRPLKKTISNSDTTFLYDGGY